MRSYIFEFDQQVALRLDLKLNELLFLDYVAQFIDSGYMRYKFIEGKRYYRLTYNKILEDLPILKVKERQLRNIITSLENKGILQRYSELKNEMHIYVDYDVVSGKKLPEKFKWSEVAFHDEGNGLLTIDYYDIKKIKIILNNARVRNIDKEEFLSVLLANLKITCGDIIYKGFIEKKINIEEITDTYIIFDVKNVEMIGQTYGKKFKKAFDDTIEYLLG